MKIHTSNIDTARVMSHRQNPLLIKSEWQELYTNCVMIMAIHCVLHYLRLSH